MSSPSSWFPHASPRSFTTKSQKRVNAGHDIRRVQGTTRSPIFAAFAETLEGIVTVRAFSAETGFTGNLVQRADLSTKVCVLVHSVHYVHRISGIDVVRILEYVPYLVP